MDQDEGIGRRTSDRATELRDMDDSRGILGVLDRPMARTRTACLVAGCPCKDARIVSHRRAAFYASLARQHGETADRQVPVDPEWRLPIIPG